MDLRITSTDQFRPAKLAKLFPIFLEYIKSVSIFEVFERDETLAEFCAEIVRKPSCSYNEAIMTEPFEGSKAFTRHALSVVRTFGTDGCVN